MTVYKKSLGQHILQNIGAAKRIVDSLEIEDGDHILEIGPGNGVLTGILAELPIKLVAVEIDKDMAAGLSACFGSARNITIINKDILEFDFGSLDASHKWKLVGNLPYNITAPILKKVFDNYRLFSSAMFTVQKEVADRLTATRGSPDYSSLTIFAQTYCLAEKLFQLRPGSFFPPPKVSSTVVRLRFNESVFVEHERLDGFHRFVQVLFSHRRKTILNCLTFTTSLLDKNRLATILEDANIDVSSRPQNLSLTQFASLFLAVNEVEDA